MTAQKDSRNRWRNAHDPKINIPPTVMQVYPEGWQPNLHTPCYFSVGNWLDGTVEEFMTSNNIRLIVRASGQAGDAYKPPGKEYGVNALVEFGRPWVPR